MLSLVLERQPAITTPVPAVILPGACRSDFVTCPPEATNLAAALSLTSGTGPVTLEVCPVNGSGPACESGAVNELATNTTLVVNKASDPPLNPGRYTFRTCNPGTNVAWVEISARFEADPSRLVWAPTVSRRATPLPDDAVTTSVVRVTNQAPIAAVEVGIRVNHSRVSDLSVVLVSPVGTRVLLAENRGGPTASSFGNDVLITNVQPVLFSGGPEAHTNIIETGQTSGSIHMDWDFYPVPDTMRVYYETNTAFDSGLVSDVGATNITYGPGESTQLAIVMNPEGNPNTNTAWFYTVTFTTLEHQYALFTDDPARSTIPIKLAAPPLAPPVLAGVVTNICFAPEEPLNKLAGEPAYGDWRLEVWDNRVGPGAGSPEVVSWELWFRYGDSMPAPLALEDGLRVTNTLGAGKTQYYYVDVPAWAEYSTNWLVAASAPVTLLFNPSALPTGTNTSPSDSVLAAGTTEARVTLQTNGSPPLARGARYYLALQNTNAMAITYIFETDLDILSLSNGVPRPYSCAAGPWPKYFSFDVSSNATAASFQLLDVSGNPDLTAGRGKPLPTLTNFDAVSLFPGSNSEQIILFTNSTPVPLAPGRWYLGVFNAGTNPAAASIVAAEFTTPLPPITALTSAVPHAGTNQFLPSPADYFRFEVGTNALRAQFEIIQPEGDMTLVARKGLPLPNLGSYDLISANVWTNDEVLELYPWSSPVALTPGEWFLAAVNASGAPVAYTIMATEFSAAGTNIVLTASQAGDMFCISWDSLPGTRYVVEARPDLSGTNWSVISGTITATNVRTTWCLPLPSLFRFFRVREGMVQVPCEPPPARLDIRLSASGVLLTWTSAACAQFEVQWSPTLVPPAWTAFTNGITSTNFLFAFLDDGSQSGGLEAARYYRLIQRVQP
jgi:subtilisin-like proprotein convertase family protein